MKTIYPLRLKNLSLMAPSYIQSAYQKVSGSKATIREKQSEFAVGVKGD